MPPSPAADAAATAVDSLPLSVLTPDRIETGQPRIERWAVVGHDRIAGTVFGRPGASDGRTIITSPVVQVRLLGDVPAPVAVTASGSAYRLGEPAAHFGMDRAEHFVWFKSRNVEAQPRPPHPDERTALLPLAGAR